MNASLCCHGCGWLHVSCSGLERATDRPRGFQSPPCISKAVDADSNVPTSNPPTDPHTKNQNRTTPLKPRETQVVADYGNDGPMVTAARQNAA